MSKAKSQRPIRFRFTGRMVAWDEGHQLQVVAVRMEPRGSRGYRHRLCLAADIDDVVKNQSAEPPHLEVGRLAIWFIDEARIAVEASVPFSWASRSDRSIYPLTHGLIDLRGRVKSDIRTRPSKYATGWFTMTGGVARTLRPERLALTRLRRDGSEGRRVAAKPIDIARELEVNTKTTSLDVRVRGASRGSFLIQLVARTEDPIVSISNLCSRWLDGNVDREFGRLYDVLAPRPDVRTVPFHPGIGVSNGRTDCHLMGFASAPPRVKRQRRPPGK